MRKIEEFINKVFHNDALALLPEVPSNTVDLFVTSPPYNVGIEYDNWDDAMRWETYLHWCNIWIKEMKRILKPDGRFVLNVLVNINMKKEETIQYQPVLDFGILVRRNELNIHSLAFWTDVTRTKYTSWGSWKSASCPYIYNPFESCIIGFNESWKKLNQGEDTISGKDFIYGVKGVYDFGTTSNETCPAVFPDKLPSLFIELLSYKNDIVLDPFCGSGTTLYNAKRLERRYIGIDISKRYCEIARSKLAQGYLF